MSDGSGDTADSSPGLSRRTLLFRGVLATVGLSLSGLFIKYAAQLGRGPAPGRQALSEREARVAAALFATCFPGGGRLPAVDVDAALDGLDAFLYRTDPDQRILFRAMMHVVEDQCLLFRGRFFSAATASVRLAEVRAWETTPIYTKRTAFTSVKILIGMQYAEQDSVRRAIGWYVGCAPAHIRHLSKEALKG